MLTAASRLLSPLPELVAVLTNLADFAKLISSASTTLSDASRLSLVGKGER
jgi:hypothetical protein